MLIVSLFVMPGNPVFERIHLQTSQSELDDLKQRLAMISCDVYIYKNRLHPTGHNITNCTCLWSLVGKHF